MQAGVMSFLPTVYFQTFHTLEKQTSDNQDPLYRLFYREGTIGSKLLSQVRRDLGDVVKVCEGALKQTNHLRTLMSSLTKGMFSIPAHEHPLISTQVPFLITGGATRCTEFWLSRVGSRILHGDSPSWIKLPDSTTSTMSKCGSADCSSLRHTSLLHAKRLHIGRSGLSKRST